MNDDSHTTGTQKNNISENERLVSAQTGNALVTHGLVAKKDVLETIVGKLSDYPDGNVDANQQKDGMPNNQNNKPQAKSVDEATDPSKLSQL